MSLQDVIVEKSHRLYSNLPSHGKPVIRSNGIQEWTISATISLVLPSLSSCGSGRLEDRVIPISLGTGVKCLPYSKLSKFGDTLHDSHAEIIARRGFIRWVLHQTQLALRSLRGETVNKENTGNDEVYLEFDKEKGKFELKDGIEVWLYVSMLPCGDASTLYTSFHQPTEEASQWSEADLATLPSSSTESRCKNGDGPVARGRNGYKSISTLRTKPGRPDSIPSISMSCSDKIASWSVLGIQGGLLSNILEKPIYLSGIVIGGIETPKGSEEIEWKEKIRLEVERSIWGRLESISDHLPSPYTLHRPSIHFTSIPFEHSKPSVISNLPGNSLEPLPSPLSLSYLPLIPPANPKKGNGIKPEIISDGGILGFPWRKGVLLREKGRSRISKFALLEQYESVLSRMGEMQEGTLENSVHTRGTKTYFEHKHPNGSKYQLAKTVLRGIPRKGKTTIKGLESFDNLFSTDIPTKNGVELKEKLPSPPFKGWLVSGGEYESFTSAGEILSLVNEPNTAQTNP